jgi:hypothetical protein
MPEKSGLLRWLIALVLVVPLIFSSGSSEISIAGEGPSTQPAPETQTTPATQSAPATQTAPAALPAPAKSEEPYPVKIIDKEKNTEIKKNVDKVHDSFEQDILGQVIRLDNFFGNSKGRDEKKTGYQLRVRNIVRVEQDGTLNFGASLRANVTFSNISDRLRLYVSGNNEPEQLAPRLPEDPGNPALARTAQSAKIVNTELRYGFFQTPSTNIFLGTGFSLVIPPEIFVRSHFQHTHHISDVTLVRFGETLFVNNIVGLGETTEISLERLLYPKTLLRWASTGTVAYGIHGLEWGTELSLLHELSSKSAMVLTGGAYGNTSIDDVISNYRLLAHYRRNFLRSWLFYELAPEISWPRQADGKFPTNYAMTFILEVVFKGSSTEREKKPVNP